MKYWVADGSLGKGTEVEKGGTEIDEATYSYLRENFNLLTIEVVGSKVVSRVNMAAYRRAALARLENPAFVVVDNIKIHDDELPYLGPDYFLREGGPCRVTKEQMIRLVTERNRIYTLRRSGIQTAPTPEEVDGYLLCQTI